MSGACPELASSPDDRDLNAGEVHRGVDPAVPGADRTAVQTYDPRLVWVTIGLAPFRTEALRVKARVMRRAMAYAMEGLLEALGRFPRPRWGGRRLRRARRRRIAANRARRAL